MLATPHAIRWTDHALAKAQSLGMARTDVEEAVLQHHAERQANSGAAGWIVKMRRIVVAYDHPDGDDPLIARVIIDLAVEIA